MRFLLIVGCCLACAELTGCDRSPFGGRQRSSGRALPQSAPQRPDPSPEPPQPPPLPSPPLPSPRPPHGDFSQTVDFNAIAADIEVDWTLTVTSDCRVDITQVRHNPTTGHILVAGGGRGTIDFGGLWTWEGPTSCRPADDGFIFFVMLDAQGRGLWQATMRSEDEHGFVLIENAYLAPDDSLLLSVAWEGDLFLPDGTIESAGDTRAGILLRLAPVSDVIWTKRIDVDGPAVCGDLAPVFGPGSTGRDTAQPIGWTIGCYQGKAVRIDDAGRTLWEQRLVPLGGDESYAYLFGVTPELGGAVFTTIQSESGFDLGGLIHEDPRGAASTLLTALETDTGEVRWWLPVGRSEAAEIGRGRPYVEPATDTLIVPTEVSEGAMRFHGLDPRTGDVLWTVRYVFEPATGRDRLSVRSVERTSSGRWWVSGTHRIDGVTRGYLMEVDPEDQHRARPVLDAPYLGYSGVGVLSLGDDRMLATFSGFERPQTVFGQRLAPSRLRDFETFVHLTWSR